MRITILSITIRKRKSLLLLDRDIASNGRILLKRDDRIEAQTRSLQESLFFSSPEDGDRN